MSLVPYHSHDDSTEKPHDFITKILATAFRADE